MKKRREVKDMKTAISSYLKANGLEELYLERQVLSKWEELVGKPIALRTDYVTIKEKVLYIELSSAVMRDELLKHKTRLLKLINDEAGFEMVKSVFLK